MEKTSDISGFYNLSIEERLRILRDFCNLTDDEVKLLKNTGALGLDIANRMIENVIGVQHLPLGIATHFLINGKEYFIPMAIEEPSVVAAASYAAKLARPGGGFKAEASDSLMIGQIQIINIKDIENAKKKIMEKKEELIKIANETNPTLISYGGGAKDIEIREINTIRGKMLILHLIVNVADAMGANIINTMCEAIAKRIEDLTNGKVRLRIVSNLATKRIAKAKAIWKKDVIGEEVVEGVLDAYAFALADEYRATTHNKGIMNGIDAVALACSQDWRAIEAGAHAYASLSGRYLPLTKYEKDEEGNLVGEIELPLQVGIVGGATRTNEIAKIALKILGVSSAKELAEVMASVGLAQNFAALRALATEGIQRGHMELHARNLAIMAGAKGNLIEKVVEIMIKDGKISFENAKRILSEIEKSKNF
ncbi:MAG: hydroxymethylglutaryl-CoA reductase, degradative [Candidatus Aenigmatarchaeota archaeon]